jgi:hypothetical protein
MLAPKYKELLTAYVDGELTARQRRHVMRLLHHSKEARKLLHCLQQDSRDLRAMPPAVPRRDVVGPVLDSIARRNLKPVRVPRLPPPVRFPIWTGFAAAASVLLLVGVGTFLHYSRDPDRADTTASAQRQGSTDDPIAPARAADKGLARAPQEKIDPEETPTPVLPPEESSESKEFVPPEESIEKVPTKKPAPRSASDSVFASGAKETPGQLERVELPLPSFFKLHELDQGTASRKLREQFSAPGAYRIEILCKDASKSFGRVRAGFAANKIGLVVDTLARARLKKPLYRNDFAVFAENVTPAQMVQLLAWLGVHDRTPSSAADKKAHEQRFEGTVVIQPWSSADKSELASLLKTNPAPVPPRPSGVDIRKPLPEVTESDILEGKGVPRPGSADHRAIFLSLSGTRSDYPELKRFVAGRKPLQAGKIQVFIVLRHVGP